jgi:hypothetical protein
MHPDIPGRFKAAFTNLDLDDLHDPEASTAIPLEMQDRERYFEGRMVSQVSTTDAQSQVGFLLGFSTTSILKRLYRSSTCEQPFSTQKMRCSVGTPI